MLSAMLSAAFTGVLWPAASSAQSADDRPIHYIMLQVLEDSFQDYQIALEGALRERLAALGRDYRARDEQLEDELESLDSERADKEAEFNAQRESLNRRIVAINEKIALRDARLSEDRRLAGAHASVYGDNPRVIELKSEVATQLTSIESERARYRERVEALERARARLNSEISDYLAAGHPLAQEIESLRDDWHRFAEAERDVLKSQADAYATEFLAFNNWLEGERAVLARERDIVTRALEQDREHRVLHDEYQSSVRTLIEEYNSLAEAYNRGGDDTQAQAERKARLDELEVLIDRERDALAKAREAVVESTALAEERNRHFQSLYRRHLEERRERESRLALAKTELNATRASVEAAVEARRRKIDAQIVALEADISLEVRAARQALEKASALVTAEFGRGHEGFDQAMTRVLEGNERGLLYTGDGAPRFDLSRPHTAAVYTAVERVAARRREIDAVVAALAERDQGRDDSRGGDTAAASSELEDERAGIATERQTLLETHARYATDFQARFNELDRRRQAAAALHAERRQALADLYAARAEVTRNEFLAVQRVLVAAVKGDAGAPTADDETAARLAELRSRADGFAGEVDESMRAADALLDRVRDLAPGGHATPDAPQWQDLDSRAVASVRELAGAEKAAVARAWLARLRERGALAGIERDLEASAALAHARAWVDALFLAGVMRHAGVIEQRLDDGDTAIEVVILGEAYRLARNGSLMPAPARAAG